MQISRNIVNGPKSNVIRFWWESGLSFASRNHFTHFCKPFVHYACLRLCSEIVQFILKNCVYFVWYGWSAQTTPKRRFGKHKYDVILRRHRQCTPNTNDTTRTPLNETPSMKIFCVRHCAQPCMKTSKHYQAVVVYCSPKKNIAQQSYNMLQSHNVVFLLSLKVCWKIWHIYWQSW